MKFKASLNRARQAVLPKGVLKQMQLSPGDELLVESDGDRITLRPLRPRMLVKKEFGIWVHQGRSSSLSISRLIDTERKKRIRSLL
jgi:AbrB family looped-hinge helix DNA binding protein